MTKPSTTSLLSVRLTKGGDTREYRINGSATSGLCSFWIDRGVKVTPVFGALSTLQQVIDLQAQLDQEIAQLKREGWTEATAEPR